MMRITVGSWLKDKADDREPEVPRSKLRLVKSAEGTLRTPSKSVGTASKNNPKIIIRRVGERGNAA